MKKTIKHSKKGILMVTLFATLLSFANEVSILTFKNEAKRTSLTLKNVKEGNLLSIKDDHGVTLYKELIKQTGIYSKGFDLTSLPDGSYMFELEKDFDITVMPFTVESNIVLFNKEAEKTIFKPMVLVKDDLVYVSKLALDKEPLNIDIYFSGTGYHKEYELMHSEKIENTQKIEKVFKLTGLKEGHYKIVFHSEDREFTNIIN